MKKIFISLLAIAAIISCNKENTQNNTSIEPASRFPLLKVDNLETKTILDGTQVKFKVGDCISVFNGIVSDSDHHGHCKYQCKSIDNGVASFEWMEGMDETKNPAVPFNEYEPADDVDIVATYPNRSSSTSAFEPTTDGYGEGTVMIRMVTSGSASDEDTFAGSSLPIIAFAPQGQMLKFKHTCGLLKVTLKGTAAISKVVVKGDKDITGDGSVTYAASEPVFTIVGAKIKDKTITYKYDAPVQLTAEGRDFYFGLPVGTHNVTFTFTDTDGNNMVKTAAGLKIERAVITPTELTYAADVKPVTDLSANNRYANCYVIQAPGSYSFDAKKPNGEAVTGTSATWIWAAAEQCTTASTLPSTMMSGIQYENGKISFSVPESYNGGNVVIGLVDATKKIQYTWHIWLTAAGMQDITVDGITVMDRNLGALCTYDVTTETVLSKMQYGRGNYYQWGRKDPILGSRNAGGNNALTTSGTNNQKYVINTAAEIENVSQWEVKETAGATTEEAAAQPLVFVSTNTGVANYNPSDASTPWCSRSNANPCPYGYRVMNDSEFAALINKGITYSYCSTSTNMKQYTVGGVIFPVSGNRGTDGKQANYAEGRYFSDNVDPNAANKGRYCKFTGTANATATQGSYGANTASLVRCVKVNN